jgi:ribose transport system substrate-binding protein
MERIRKQMRSISSRVAFGSGALLTVAAVLAGCGSTSSNTAGSPATASATSASDPTAATKALQAVAPYLKPPTTINVTGALKTAPPSGKTIVMLTTTDPGTTQIADTVGAVAKMVHWNYSEVSYDPANPATLNAAFQTALTKHANYIVETGLTPPPEDVAKIKAAGAKLALGSVNLSALSDPIVVDAANRQSMSTLGTVVAKYFIADSGAKGSALVVDTPSYPILTNFDTSFTSLVKTTCPACSVKTVNLSLPEVTSGGAPAALVSALRSNPGANYLAFEYAAFSSGIVPALAAAGLTDKVKVIGGLENPEVLAYVRSGAERAWAAFSSPYEAYQIMDGIFRSSEGMPVNETQEGTLPTQLLTKQTVGTTTNWNYPTTYPAQFKALWHVS